MLRLSPRVNGGSASLNGRGTAPPAFAREVTSAPSRWSVYSRSSSPSYTDIHPLNGTKYVKKIDDDTFRVYDDQFFAKQLYKESNVIVLPGSYLAVESKEVNPGKGFVRIAIVHKTEIIEQALTAVNKAYTEA